MNNLRLIARLDIKGNYLIKGVQLEGLKKIGDPSQYAKKYYDDGADELIYMDTVASLYGRNQLYELLSNTVKNIFIPITVGGGIRSLNDAKELLRCGADKVAVNTAAINNPDLISEIANHCGSSCVVLSIEAKSNGYNEWEAYTNNGRDHSGKNVKDWVEIGTKMGAGEILLTSVDREGTRKGFDINLIKQITNITSVPVIASGGMGNLLHLQEVFEQGNPNAIAIADAVHYNRTSFEEISSFAHKINIPVRNQTKI